ncbi:MULTISPECIES: hypothetical protein [Chryseobacterium]|uniref:Lipoprotein n=1 Tax=Chryseobacterium taihuense TaxID=1141221 RepID=A0A4U8WHH0_9FLAO|nr:MULTISPECIES: hypothetical protein [Chryseobacterium]QQV01887.1 hypothetical protein I6I61_12445 [Chryseobacterium sp. FDAARGOS 1104]VFB04890.1 Uncharacterised protein [Chryseobacterium taihuense]
MKKSVFLIIPLLMASCSKPSSEAQQMEDSLTSVVNTEVKRKDSVSKPIAEDSLQTEHVKSAGEAVKIVNAEKLPCTIDQKFDAKIQKLVIRIPNYSKPSIHGSISTQNNNMNVRFNQIKLSDGTYDGPFGKEISYQIKNKGEIWLIVGKNLMAEGAVEGDFSVTVE